MGITATGLIAVLTNRWQKTTPAPKARSRGAIVNAFLTQVAGQFDSTAEFVKRLVQEDDGNGGDGGLSNVGGFLLVCGKVGEPLAVISDRTESVDGTEWILRERGETVALSNAAFADRTWAKVTKGEELLRAIVREDAELIQEQRSQAGFVEKLFGLLSNDTLPRKSANGGGVADYHGELRNSIFIPLLGRGETQGANADEMPAERGQQIPQDEKLGDEGSGAWYGTQKQSVVLVSHQGHVTFVERSLYDGNGRPTEKGNRDRWFEFDVEAWRT